nr:hypothetical protein Iba_chr01cCG13470 [Ipomoea batatas]
MKLTLKLLLLSLWLSRPERKPSTFGQDRPEFDIIRNRPAHLTQRSHWRFCNRQHRNPLLRSSEIIVHAVLEVSCVQFCILIQRLRVELLQVLHLFSLIRPHRIDKRFVEIVIEICRERQVTGIRNDVHHNPMPLLRIPANDGAHKSPMGYASINDIQKVESTALDRGAAPQICKYRCTSFHRLPWVTALIDEAQQWRSPTAAATSLNSRDRAKLQQIPVRSSGELRTAAFSLLSIQQRRHANELAEAFPCFRRQWQS